MPIANGVMPAAATANGYNYDRDQYNNGERSSSVIVTKKYETNDQGKDEDEYMDKVQENSCTVLLKDEKHKVGNIHCPILQKLIVSVLATL